MDMAVKLFVIDAMRNAGVPLDWRFRSEVAQTGSAQMG
jgi:hypothetical protein